mgnify:CR=1 FL=1
MSGFSNQNGDIASPSGSIIVYAGLTSPPGWLLCDGSAYLKGTYSSLFAVIGNRYGGTAADNSFNVPDLKSTFIRGAAQTNILTKTTSGADTVTLTEANLPSHKHSYSMPSHKHTYNDAAYMEAGGSNAGLFGSAGGGDVDNGFYWRQADKTLGAQASDIETGDASASGLQTDGTGSGSEFSIVPVNLEMNYIIKC